MGEEQNRLRGGHKDLRGGHKGLREQFSFRCGSTLTLPNVLGVLNVLNMPKDVTFSCWALFTTLKFMLLSPKVKEWMRHRVF